MHLYDLAPMDELAWLMENKYVREVEHPHEPLRLLNYTDRAQVKPEIFAQVPALNHCRGLIWNTDNGEIVARPFRKFWNHGQAGADQIGLAETVYTLDKLDGSLGILYRQPNSGTLSIATRGSFTSGQALHATRLLQTKYDDLSGPEDPREKHHSADDETFLFEIIYPENRIVVDYRGRDDLFLLGSVDLEDGYVYDPFAAQRHLGWVGPTVQLLDARTTLADALVASPRENREGMVIATEGGKKMVKLKQEDYVRLHRLVTGLSERRVWEAIVAGETLAATIEPLPDEFHPWVMEVWTRLELGVKRRWSNFKVSYQAMMNEAFKAGVINLVDEEWSVSRTERAALAPLFAMAGDDQWAYWALLDGKDIKAKLWAQAKPEAGLTPSNAPKED
jgi:RNA ligase